MINEATVNKKKTFFSDFQIFQIFYVEIFFNFSPNSLFKKNKVFIWILEALEVFPLTHIMDRYIYIDIQIDRQIYHAVKYIRMFTPLSAKRYLSVVVWRRRNLIILYLRRTTDFYSVCQQVTSLHGNTLPLKRQTSVLSITKSCGG